MSLARRLLIRRSLLEVGGPALGNLDASWSDHALLRSHLITVYTIAVECDHAGGHFLGGGLLLAMVASAMLNALPI